MNSSYSADPYTQASQFQPATFSQVHYQNPTTTRSNPAQPRTAPLEAPRPRSIAELAEIAKLSLGENARPFKTWLRIAETARRDAKSFQEQGVLEPAFIEFARAATIVLEKIPSHPDYRVLLSQTQRHNMGLVSYLNLQHFACHQNYHATCRLHLPTHSTYDHAFMLVRGSTKRHIIRTCGFQFSFSHYNLGISRRSFRLNTPPVIQTWQLCHRHRDFTRAFALSRIAWMDERDLTPALHVSLEGPPCPCHLCPLPILMLIKYAARTGDS